MATIKEVDYTAVSGSDQEPPTEEDTDVEPHPHIPERRHVDVLLEISDQDFMRELEPYEYHCYPGLEEIVRGWSRVAPLSCILLTQKKLKKPKHKEADNTTLSVNSALTSSDSSAGSAENHCELRAQPQSNFKKPMPLNQQVGSWSNNSVAALQLDASEWPVVNTMQKTTSLSLKEKINEDAKLRDVHVQPYQLSPVSENRSTKVQKHIHRPNNIVVPIKNLTFLPPIKSPHLNVKVSSYLGSGKNPSEAETLEGNCLMFDKKSETRGAKVDPVAATEPYNYSPALTSKYRTCQHNPHSFSTLNVPLPKRYQVPKSSKSDKVDHRGFSVGKSLTQTVHTNATTGAQAYMHPSCLFSVSGL